MFVTGDSVIALRVPGISQVCVFFPEVRQNIMLLSVIIIIVIKYSCFLIKSVALSLGILISKVGLILPMLEACYEDCMSKWM